jgi:hypothetical protein
MLQKSVTNTPLREGMGSRFNSRLFFRDLVLTLLAAVFTGLSGSMLLILLVFSWGVATADGLDQPSVELRLRSLDGQQLQQAPGIRAGVVHQRQSGLMSIQESRELLLCGALRYLLRAEAESGEAFGLESAE